MAKYVVGFLTFYWQFEYNLFVIGHPTNGSLLSAMQHNTESGVSQRQLAASTYYFIFIKLLSQALGLSTRPNRHIFWPLWKADVCTAIHSIYTLLVFLNFNFDILIKKCYCIRCSMNFNLVEVRFYLKKNRAFKNIKRIL